MKVKLQVPEIQSAHAILTLNGDYILQLRDNRPNVAAAGQWSLFGGRIQDGEIPLQSIQREIYEELAIQPAEYRYLWFIDYFAPFEKRVIRTWFFTTDVTAVWSGHQLLEGKAVNSFTFEQLAGLDMPKVMYRTLEQFHQQAREENED